MNRILVESFVTMQEVICVAVVLNLSSSDVPPNQFKAFLVK